MPDTTLQPVPNNPIGENHQWRDFFTKFRQAFLDEANGESVSGFTGTVPIPPLVATAGSGTLTFVNGALKSRVDPTVGSSTSGFTGTITTAKLTGGGANGSMTFVNGVLTAQVAAT